jgi:hypothetical protein
MTTATKKDLEKAVPLDVTLYENTQAEGFEEADRDSYAIPLLKLLQKMSPEVDEADGAFIEGAKPGMFLNNATGRMGDGKEGIVIVPVHFSRRFLQWMPREDGGGFKGSWSPGEAAMMQGVSDDRGRLVLPDGSYLSDTREHYVLWLDGSGGFETCVISLASTQIKKSKKWMTAMQSRKMARADGSTFTPPMYSHAWRVQAVPESNDQGSWYGWKFSTFEDVGEVGIVNAARAFREAILSGEAKAEQPADEATEVPF